MHGMSSTQQQVYDVLSIKTNVFLYSPDKEDPLFLALKGPKAMKNGKGRRASAMNDSQRGERPDYNMLPSTEDIEEFLTALEEIDEMGGDPLDTYRRPYYSG